MSTAVNSRSGANRDAQQQRRVATEERLVAAATTLFIRDGYVATTLAAVATEAGVAPRTVYLRFGTKAALLKRAIDVALVGDTAPVDLQHRESTQRTLTAQTLEQRIEQATANARAIFTRIGPLLAVGEEAAVLEPDIRASIQADREATREQMRRFWRSAADDGLLPPGADVEWLADTAVMTCAAEVFGFSNKVLGWDADTYADWLRTTWLRLAATAQPS